jgi:hypothetical protein
LLELPGLFCVSLELIFDPHGLDLKRVVLVLPSLRNDGLSHIFVSISMPKFQRVGIFKKMEFIEYLCGTVSILRSHDLRLSYRNLREIWGYRREFGLLRRFGDFEP